MSTACSIHGKNREISVPYSFWTTVKISIPENWNWNCWTSFGLEIEVGGHTLPLSLPPPPSLVATLLDTDVKNRKLLSSWWRNVKCHIQHSESWLRWIVIEQVNYKEHYFPLKISERNCARTLSKPLRKKQSWCIPKKMKTKYMKEDMWKSFFS